MLRPLLILVLLLAGVTAAQGAELSEPTGGFAYTIPEGWQTRELPGLKYKIAYGPAAKGFAPNINVVNEAFAGSVEEYAALNLKAITGAFAEFRNLGQTSFVTTSGLKGVRLVTQAKQQDRLLRQVFYFLPGKANRKYVVTFSALLEDGPKHDAIADASIKTFVLR